MLQKNRCYSMRTNLWDTDKQGQNIIECISFKNKNHSWDTVWQTRADYRIHKFKKNMVGTQNLTNKGRLLNA
jgi:hypothetical protein